MSEKTKFVGNMNAEVWAELIASISDGLNLSKFEQYIHMMEQDLQNQLKAKGGFDAEIDASINMLEFQKALYQQIEFNQNQK